MTPRQSATELVERRELAAWLRKRTCDDAINAKYQRIATLLERLSSSEVTEECPHISRSLHGEYCVCCGASLIEQPPRSAATSSDGWLPIESAPKDGTPVLLGYFRENLDGSIYEEGGEPIVARWIGRFRDTTGWVARRERLVSEGPFSPSHWRRCPEPPRSAAPSKEQHP